MNIHPNFIVYYCLFLGFKELPYDLKDLLEQKNINLKVSYFSFIYITFFFQHFDIKQETHFIRLDISHQIYNYYKQNKKYIQDSGLHRKKMPGVRPSHAIKSKLNFLACDSRTPYNLWRAMLKKYFFTNVTP